MHNLRLKACLKEIEKIMKKYDAGGAIILAGEEGGEFKMINPRWSTFRIMPGGHGVIKFRKNNELGANLTIHMFQVILDACGRLFLNADQIIKQAENHLEIEGGPKYIDPNN